MGKVNESTKSMTWLTYRQTLDRVYNLAHGLWSLVLKTCGDKVALANNTWPEQVEGLKQPRNYDTAVCAVGLYAINSVDYIVSEYACYMHSLVVVPIYDTLGPNICSYIVNQGKWRQWLTKLVLLSID